MSTRVPQRANTNNSMDFSPPPKPRDKGVSSGKRDKHSAQSGTAGGIKIQMKKREAMESILEEEENATTTVGQGGGTTGLNTNP